MDWKRIRRKLGAAVCIAWLSTLPAVAAHSADAGQSELLAVETFFDLFSKDRDVYGDARDRIFASWRLGYLPMVLETARFGSHTAELLKGVERVTGQRFRGDMDRALEWMWAQDYSAHPEYARFKATLYGNIDPRFVAYFDDETETARIRLDEVRWGGVARDGIPPLSKPKMIAAPDATYLSDDNVVFGLAIGDDARAYPKRILAWHEMFKDVVGGVSVNGVYCTLCNCRHATSPAR